MKLKPTKYYHLINHGPCCLVTTGNETIKNIAPIAWLTPINDEPPIVGVCIAETHYTAELIEKYKEFVINIPSKKFLKVIKITGSISGRYKDKFSLTKILTKQGVKVKTVHIEGCVGFIEAKLIDKVCYEGVQLFIGRVLYCEVKDECYRNRLLPQKAKTLHHIGDNKFFVSNKTIR
ncbi:MAG: flavin reductase family protein [Endomicrobia bacterium]|nr:flavin reductase family protein [Endomicrobiia bacterium]